MEKNIPTLAVIACLHGNEEIGAKIKLNSSVTRIIGNKTAKELNQRFVESDLNRSFPWQYKWNA